jgi:hypothetical protein
MQRTPVGNSLGEQARFDVVLYYDGTVACGLREQMEQVVAFNVDNIEAFMLCRQQGSNGATVSSWVRPMGRLVMEDTKLDIQGSRELGEGAWCG